MTIDIKELLPIINQIFELERKLQKERNDDSDTLLRNVSRMKRYMENIGITYHNPIGESYDETRTDCLASITGTGIEELYISEVIKPIIRRHEEGDSVIIQQAIVVCKSRLNQT